MNSCFPHLTSLNIGDEQKINSGYDSTGEARRKSHNCPSDCSNTEYEKTSSRGICSMSLSNNELQQLDRKLTVSSDTAMNNITSVLGGKTENIRNLDLLYMKQIARNLKEYDLEQKIELEIKMREGTTKLLAACKHQTQMLEASKSLLVSNERMNAYMAELQKRKKETTHARIRKCSEGRLSISELRIPLIWRDTDHFKNKGDSRRFAVFCLIRLGSEMYDTSLLYPVDRTLTDLTFPDSLIFNNVTPDFILTLEVYSHKLQDELSIVNAPRRIKNTIHTSISRTVGKKLAATIQDEINIGKIRPNFELVASATLSLDDANDSVRTHDLRIENAGSYGRHNLPLFGHFCCRLAVQPTCMMQDVYSGSLYVPQSFIDSNINVTTVVCIDGENWVKCLARLVGFKLKLWTSKRNFAINKQPDASISINKSTIANCKNSSSLKIEISQKYNANERVTIKFESSQERTSWFMHLIQHIHDSERWKQAADTEMAIQMNEPSRHSFVTAKHRSLYDQTPIMGNEFDVANIDSCRLFGGNICANTSTSDRFKNNSLLRFSSSPADLLPPFRARSSSSFSKLRTFHLSTWSFSRNYQ